MEKDKQLKEILLKGAESASANFTASVMKRVNNLSSTFYYQPLVSDKMKRAFIFTFAALIILILLLCLVIGSADILPFINRIKIPPLSVLSYYKILIFIISFWVVFTINSVIEKNRLKLN